MKWSTIGSAAILVASAFATQTPALTKILNDISTLNTSVNQVQSTLNTFVAGDFSSINIALSVQSESQDVLPLVQSTYKDVVAAPVFDSNDSDTLAEAFLNFIPTIEKLLKSLVAKKPQFSTVGFGIVDTINLVHTNLVQQAAGANQLGTALGSKLSGGLGSAAPAINKQLQASFSSAISVYAPTSSIYFCGATPSMSILTLGGAPVTTSKPTSTGKPMTTHKMTTAKSTSTTKKACTSCSSSTPKTSHISTTRSQTHATTTMSTKHATSTSTKHATSTSTKHATSTSRSL